MSTYIIPMFIQGYEDYEEYKQGGNAFSGWPDMWPEERYAEGALWRERKEMMEQIRMYGRIKESYTPSTESSHPTVGGLSVIERALISIAKENEWKIKNQYSIEHYDCSPIFEIPPRAEDEEPMPDDWYAAVRWMDRQETKREQRLSEEERKKAEREADRRKATRWDIDAVALLKFMGDLMPAHLQLAVSVNTTIRHRNRMELQEAVCAELAKANGWKRTDGNWYNGYKRVYRTA